MPSLFPPVLIDVESNGQHFQQMHVDGGAVAQMFLYSPSIACALTSSTGRLPGSGTLISFAIRAWTRSTSTDRRLLSIIIERAINTMIHYSGCNDAFRIYASSRRDGVDYNLAYIGTDFTVEHKLPFDQTYMRALFDYGYRQGRADDRWRKAPPNTVTGVTGAVTGTGRCRGRLRDHAGADGARTCGPSWNEQGARQMTCPGTQGSGG